MHCDAVQIDSVCYQTGLTLYVPILHFFLHEIFGMSGTMQPAGKVK